ncbi:MAG TPA: phage tail tube protein [Thermoanaerobaculia bacterium]|nr:phage tail tube protein [Thermoanaerobaculia bacterium]HQP89078.1 phage tail tube protein [Thermoanaerobaculia bacterium]
MADPATGNVPIIVDFEQSWGVAKMTPVGRKLSVIECNIVPNRGFQDNPSLRAGWNPAKPFPGAAKPGGTIRLVPNVHAASFFQKLLTGTLVKSGATKATGTIVCVPKADLIDGETVTLDDGTNVPTVFEFDVNGTGVSGGNVQVDVSSATTAIDVAAILHAAINGVGAGLAITSTNPGTGTLNLQNDAEGSDGNVAITDTVADTDFTHTGMSGGTPLPYLATSKLGSTMPKSAIVEFPVTVAGVTKYWRATGVRVQSWTIPIAHEGALIVDIGVGAKNVKLETSAYDASPDDWSAATQIDQTKLQSGFVKIGGVAVGYLRGGSLTGDTRLQDDFRAGVDGRGSLVPMVHTLGGSLDLALDSADALTYITDGGVVDVELKWLVEADRYWLVKHHVILEPSGPPVKDGLINVTANIRGFEDTGTGTAVEFETSVGTDPDVEYA